MTVDRAETDLDQLNLTAEELADMDGLTFETMWVTPSIGKQWLGDMIQKQRNLKPRKLASFTNDMKHGRWRQNGDVVRFNRKGEFIDGHHRVRALIDSGIPGLTMTVVRGVDEAAITTIDTGSARTFADVLKMESNDVAGTPNQNVLAAIVRRVYYYDKGNPLASSGVITLPSHNELLGFQRTDPGGFRAATARGEDLRRAKVGGSTVGGTMYYILRRLDPDRAFEFFDQLLTGANLGARHPILKLRDRLKDGGPARGDRDSPTDQMILYTRAWNAWRKDTEVDRLIINGPTEITNKNFPKPI